MKLQDNKIYLASKSPRRRELLRQIGIHFEILLLRDGTTRPYDVSEDVLPNESPENYVRRVTHVKAVAAWNMMLMRKLPIRPVLAADTTVVLNGKIFGKPATRNEAHAMLSSLSGQTHQVLTSIAVHFHDTLLARTKLNPPVFPTAAEPLPVKPAVQSTPSLDIAAIAHAAVADQAIEERIRGNS